ncbi:sulfatase [Paenibacillus sp. JSM ZJ436]|uniref:Arylsulfatase A family protein n=1 Tax=Paenibacillus algicola TaxID=2565926 RepID=A0A4V1G3K4_9BACL|nr:sulfatase-like hydrolase/transferase [Paenibacillus algicola]QCT01504.1 arylsulfatase A family protein [Paenibacillus algicola]
MNGYNILFIMTDQLRLDALGKTGGWVKTPHIDALAAEGMLFTNCITNSPVCIPARVSLATGLYPHNTGVWKNIEYDLPADSSTWMQTIRDAGYRTGLIGKTHLHRHIGDLREREHLMHTYGFDHVDEIGGPRASMWVGSHMTDEWSKAGVLDAYIQEYNDRFTTKPYVARPSVLPLSLYADVYVGTKAQAFISSYKDDKPWFCMVSFGGPHEPWDAPEPYASMYEPEQMPKPIPRPSVDSTRPIGHLDELMNENRHSPVLEEQDIAAMRANYAGNVTLIDEQIGQILQVLKEKNELDKTVIVFTADHGEMNGDYGLLYKENFLNAAVKVPLIIWTPELKSSEHAGAVYDGMVELFDIGPSMCELAGTQLAHRHFAKSLSPVLEDPRTVHREEAISEIHGEVMLQNREWKLVLNAQGTPYLLFHLTEDPNEQRNLVGEPAYGEVVQKLKDTIFARLMSSLVYKN